MFVSSLALCFFYLLVHYFDGNALIGVHIDGHFDSRWWHCLLAEASEAEFEDYFILLIDDGAEIEVFMR